MKGLTKFRLFSGGILMKQLWTKRSVNFFSSLYNWIIIHSTFTIKPSVLHYWYQTFAPSMDVSWMWAPYNYGQKIDYTTIFSISKICNLHIHVIVGCQCWYSTDTRTDLSHHKCKCIMQLEINMSNKADDFCLLCHEFYVTIHP